MICRKVVVGITRRYLGRGNINTKKHESGNSKCEAGERGIFKINQQMKKLEQRYGAFFHSPIISPFKSFVFDVVVVVFLRLTFFLFVTFLFSS